jgi:hypothetical protein
VQQLRERPRRPDDVDALGGEVVEIVRVGEHPGVLGGQPVAPRQRAGAGVVDL